MRNGNNNTISLHALKRRGKNKKVLYKLRFFFFYYNIKQIIINLVPNKKNIVFLLKYLEYYVA